MRIAFVNQDPGIDPGRHKGAAVHLQAMREALSGLGAEVHCFDEPRPDELAQALEEAHAAGLFDLTYERYALGADTTSRWSRSHSVPHVLEVNSPLLDEERRWRTPTGEDPPDERNVFAGARAVIAVSSQVARYAYERGARAGSVEVFANGVDTERFRPRSPEDPTRSRLVPRGRVAIGFHGRLRPWHGFDRIVAATAELLREGLPVQLVVVGEGPFEEELEGRLPADNITRLPWLAHEEVAPVVAAFDLLPLAYRPELPCYFSPLKLAEAMAAGVVPVVPQLGDLPQIVRDGWNGIVFDPEDGRGLVEGLLTLVESPDRRRILAERARESAARMDWTRIARYVIDLAATERSAAAGRSR